MSSQGFFILFESASGFALFEVVQHEEIAALVGEVQHAIHDFGRFHRLLKLKSFEIFLSTESALSNINSISEGIVTDDLKVFLEMNLPTVKKSKSPKVSLGVLDTTLATAIQDAIGFPCRSDETVREITRGIRFHFPSFVKELDNGLWEKSQLGLAHGYSRAKVKFNPHRADNMIIQSICILDQLDKDINTFAMRIREWYCYHFPELREIVKDNYLFARCAAFIQDRSTLSEEKVQELAKIVLDQETAEKIFTASKISVGMDCSEVDMTNVVNFASLMIKMAERRQKTFDYLVERLSIVAPNLSSLVGDIVAARLIAKAGSLVSLAKCPASTIQILGAEKALFRALKKKGNTPKYGLIYNCSFIGRAGAKNKGRISRYLANKCAIASRIDSFIETPTNRFGEKMKEQVEERLSFFEKGQPLRKNVDVMAEVARELKNSEKVENGNNGKLDNEGKNKKKKDKKQDKKRAREEEEVEENVKAVEVVQTQPKKKKKKN